MSGPGQRTGLWSLWVHPVRVHDVESPLALYRRYRPETFLAGSNFLAPPIDKALMVSVVHNVFEHRAELEWERVYPEKASAMLVDAVERRLEDDSLLISEEWRYGLKAQLR